MEKPLSVLSWHQLPLEKPALQKKKKKEETVKLVYNICFMSPGALGPLQNILHLNTLNIDDLGSRDSTGEEADSPFQRLLSEKTT